MPAAGDAHSSAPIPRAKHVADLHRLLAMAVMFQGRQTWTPQKLAERFGVAERTIYRDLKKIQGIGIPVVFDRAKGTYKIDGAAFLQPIQLSADEALALIVLCEDLAGREQIGLLKPAYSALAKIEAQLPEALREDVGKVMDKMMIQLARSSEHEDERGADRLIRQAMAEGRALEIEYRVPGRKSAESFLLEPYGLLFGHRAWYVIGRSGKHDAVRTLKLLRIRRATLTERKYAIPEDFTIGSHLGNAWMMMRGERDQDVEVRFNAGSFAENIIETRWHQTQKVQAHADGSVSLHFKVSGLDEIQWWVLGMGPSCRVIKPAELADRVKDLAVRTAALYAGGGVGG